MEVVRCFKWVASAFSWVSEFNPVSAVHLTATGNVAPGPQRASSAATAAAYLKDQSRQSHWGFVICRALQNRVFSLCAADILDGVILCGWGLS